MQVLAADAPEAAGYRAPVPSSAVAAATAAPSAAGKATSTMARPPSAQRAAAKRRKSISSMDGDGPPKRPTAVDFPQRKPVFVLEFHLMAAREAAQKAREERIRRQPNAQLGFPSFRQEPPLYIPFQEGPPTLPTPPSTPVSLFPTHAVQQDLARPLPSLSQQRLHAAMLNQGCDIPAANQGVGMSDEAHFLPRLASPHFVVCIFLSRSDPPDISVPSHCQPNGPVSSRALLATTPTPTRFQS